MENSSVEKLSNKTKSQVLNIIASLEFSLTSVLYNQAGETLEVKKHDKFWVQPGQVLKELCMRVSLFLIMKIMEFENICMIEKENKQSQKTLNFKIHLYIFT